MSFLRAAPAVLCVAFLGAAISPIAKADEWDKKTVVTFSAPVEIPGVHLEGWGILPAGTYVFKLLDSTSDRHIVQILNQAQTKVYATILAIPNYRLRATDKTVITFNERPAGQPEALRAWFYPGRNWGDEFVYPKERAVALAQETHLPVLAVVADVPLVVARPEEPVVVAQLTQAPIMAVQPTGEVVEVAQVVQAAPVEVAAAPTPIQEAVATEPGIADTLPATASSMPLIALFGLLALGGALSIRSIRRRAL
jgi:LPXTG-motif cell wall-anchored protein